MARNTENRSMQVLVFIQHQIAIKRTNTCLTARSKSEEAQKNRVDKLLVVPVVELLLKTAA